MVSLPLSPKLPSFPLGITVLAEGVETSIQVTQLRRLGCNLAQGDYFSEPLTSGQLRSFWQPLSATPVIGRQTKARINQAQ